MKIPPHKAIHICNSQTIIQVEITKEYTFANAINRKENKIRNLKKELW